MVEIKTCVLTCSELCAILPLLFQSKASKDSLYDWYSSWSMFSPRMLRYPHFSNNNIKCYIWGLEVTLCHATQKCEKK